MTGVAGATIVWRRSAHALTRRTPRSVLMTTSISDDPVQLEGAALFVWDELARPATDDQLADRIATRFSVAGDEMKAHVLTARAALSDIGAIVEFDG